MENDGQLYQSRSKSGSLINHRMVCFIVGLFALFAPVVLIINFFDIIIIAMTWYYGTYVGFNVIYPLNSIIFFVILLRIGFVYQIFSYYEGRISRRKTIALGIFAELLPYLGVLSPIPLFPIPTPLMLFSALAFMWFRPYEERILEK